MPYPLEKVDEFNKLNWFEDRLAGFSDSTAMVWKDRTFSYC